MDGSLTGTQKRSRQPHLVKRLQKKEVERTACIHQYSIELDGFYDGADYSRILPRLWYNVWVVTAVEGDWDFGPSKVLRGGRTDRQNLSGCEFLLPLGLIWVGASENIVDLLVGLEELTLGILRLLLLIGRLGCLENLICKTLESVTILGLVLSLGVENANGIQEAFKFAWPRPVLIMMMRSFYRIDRTV
jgi:hypothetical protein